MLRVRTREQVLELEESGVTRACNYVRELHICMRACKVGLDGDDNSIVYWRRFGCFAMVLLSSDVTFGSTLLFVLFSCPKVASLFGCVEACSKGHSKVRTTCHFAS